MENRWDDLGTVTFFHQSNFPGVEEDKQGAISVLKELLKKENDRGMVKVSEWLNQSTTRAEAERTERYISYWLILGVLEDYEVTGMDKNTTYYAKRHPAINKYLGGKEDSILKPHVVDNLHRYLSRYRPSSRADVEERLDARQEEHLSTRSIAYLVEFIYEQIEYQQREAIRTMVAFCNEADTSPDRLRARIKAYFDTSDKFSKNLLLMADSAPAASNVVELLSKIDGFDDVEHLYWETRRLLDERFRSDWAGINLFTIAYREKAEGSDAFMRQFADLIVSLRDDDQYDHEAAVGFLKGFLAHFSRLDGLFGEELSSVLLGKCLEQLYRDFGLEYMRLIDDMDLQAGVCDYLHARIALVQLGEVTDARYSRVAQ